MYLPLMKKLVKISEFINGNYKVVDHLDLVDF